ncbi:MAG TPA: amino acid permease [Polyangia bacterium]|jgi:amino acid transporter
MPAPEPGLPRRLGLLSATALVVGSAIGSGIFRSPAAIADQLPGPAALLGVWAVAGAFALAGALTLAEIAGALPRTGGLYAFIAAGWGRLPAFLFGWAQLVLIRAAALGAIATTFAEYACRLAGAPPQGPVVRIVAAAALAVTATTNILGVRFGAAVQNLTTAAKYFGLLFIVAVALIVGLPRTGGHFTPAAPAGSFGWAPFGLALVAALWAYDGWADLSFVAGEVRDPRRTLPRALIGGAILIIAVYLAANVAYLAVLPVAEIRHSKLVAADAAARLLGAGGVTFVALTVVLSTFGTLNASLLTTPRVFFAMGEDRLFFQGVAAVHPRFRTPWVAIGLAAVLGIAFVLVQTFEQLADTFVTANLPFYALAVAAIFPLRRQPGYDPAFRVPGYPVVPCLFVAAVLFLLGNAIADPASRWRTLAVLGVVAAGAPVYWATVGRRR